MMTQPIRLQLSRRKGFDLQALSMAFNGREAVNCARPGKWGNPFLVHPKQKPGTPWQCGRYRSVATIEDAIECFRSMMTEPMELPPDSVGFRLRADIGELRGKNLACWCAHREPCHCDVLLEIANAGEINGR